MHLFCHHMDTQIHAARVYHENLMVTQRIEQATAFQGTRTFISVYWSHVNAVHTISLRSTIFIQLITALLNVLFFLVEVYRHFVGTCCLHSTLLPDCTAYIQDNSILSNGNENVKSNIITAIYQPICA
jgi:hypothetical protein